MTVAFHVPGAMTAQAASPGEDLVASWVEQIRQTGETVTIGTQTYDAAADRVDLGQIEIRRADRPDTVATIREMHFEGLTANGGAAHQVKRAWADGLALSQPDGDLTAAHVEVRDLFWPTIKDPFAGMEPGLPAALKVFDVFRPFRLELGEVSDIRFGFDSKDMTAGSAGHMEAVVGRIAIERLKDNRLDAISVGPLQIDGKDASGKAVSVKMEKLAITGVDLSSVEAVIDPARYRDGKGDGIWRNVVTSYAIDKVSFSGGGLTAGIDHYGYDALAVRQTDVPAVERLAALVGEGKEPTTDAEKTEAAGLIIDVLSSVRLGGYGISGLWLHADPGATPDTPDGLDVKLGRIGIRDLSLKGLGEFLLAGIEAKTSPVQFRLGEARVSDVVLPEKEAVIAAVLAVVAGEEPNPVPLMPKIGLVRLMDFSLAAPPSEEVSLARVELSQSDYLQTLPTKLGLIIDKLHLPASLPDKDWQKSMALMEMKALDLSGELRLAFDHDKSELRLEKLDLSLADGASGSASMALSGVTAEMLLDPRTIETHVGELGFLGGSIALTNQTLVGRLLKLAAGQQKGTTAEQVKAGLVASLPKVLGPIPNAALRADAIAAAKRLLDGRATVTVTSAPKDAIPFLQIVATAAANPWRLPDILMLAVKSAN